MPNMPGQQADTDSDDTRSDSKVKNALRSGGSAAREQGQKAMERVAEESSARSSERSPNSERTAHVDSYRKGGKVRKTGPARLHSGEIVKKRGRGKRKRFSGRY